MTSKDQFPTKVIQVTSKHLALAQTFFDHTNEADLTEACIMNQALRDAFPEMIPHPPEEPDSRFACNKNTWNISSSAHWHFDATGSNLIDAFDSTNQNDPNARKPFPDALLPATVVLTYHDDYSD